MSPTTSSPAASGIRQSLSAFRARGSHHTAGRWPGAIAALHPVFLDRQAGPGDARRLGASGQVCLLQFRCRRAIRAGAGRGAKASFSFLCECQVASYLDPDPPFAGVPSELRKVDALDQAIAQLSAQTARISCGASDSTSRPKPLRCSTAACGGPAKPSCAPATRGTDGASSAAALPRPAWRTAAVLRGCSSGIRSLARPARRILNLPLPAMQ